MNNANTKSKLDLAKEAQAEVQETLTTKRIEFLEALEEFRSIGGEDDVQVGVLKIVERYPNGVPYLFLQTVFPDTALTAAREALKETNKIVQVGRKGNVIIKLAEAK